MDYENAVRGYFEAFLKRDWEWMESRLSDDFTFTSQYDDHISKQEFKRDCWDMVEDVGPFDVAIVMSKGSDVMVRYKGSVNGQDVQNVEHFVFEGEKLRSVTVFFGRA